MKKKIDNDTLRIVIIVSVGFILLIVLCLVYQSRHHRETWLVCHNETNKYPDYEETIKYRYVGSNLYGFYREEKITEKKKEDLDERYQYFIDIKEELTTSDNLAYDITKNEDNVEVKTYIGVANLPSFFNNYIKSTPIKATSTVKEVEEYYNSIDYQCEKSYK